MKSVKRIKRKLVGCMAIVAALVIGVVTPSIVKKVNAATPGVFTEYDKNISPIPYFVNRKLGIFFIFFKNSLQSLYL